MNEILEEVREAKRQVNARFNGDIHKYCADVMRRQEELKKQGIKFLRLNGKHKSNPAFPKPCDIQSDSIFAFFGHYRGYKPLPQDGSVLLPANIRTITRLQE